MPDSWNGLGEYFSHEDKHGDPVEVGRDRPLCGVQLLWDSETDGTAQCTLPSRHTGLHGLGPNSGDYLSGRMTEDVLMELLRRVSSLEQVTGRHSASLNREPVPEDVRQTLRGIGRGITAIQGKLERLGAEPVKWVTPIGEIELTPDMLSEAADAMDQVGDAGGHVYDQPVQLRCDVHDWCVLDRGHREDCSELR